MSALDPFIPRPDIRERCSVVIRAPAEVVMRIAREFDMQSVPLVRLIFALRERLTGSTPVARIRRGIVAETTALGWGTLQEEKDRLHIAGAYCRPWEGDVHFHPLAASDFAGWSGPEQVKIAWTLEAEPLGPSRTRFSSETRAVATDENARRRFRRYWRWAGSGIVAIRWLLLPAIRRRAEAEAG